MQMASVREEARRKYKTKRLQEAFIFLNSITFDGSIDLSNLEQSDDHQSVEQPPICHNAGNIANDASLALLISNASLEGKKPHLLQSVSVTGSANVEEELRHQKIALDPHCFDTGQYDGYNKITRSRSTMEATKDLFNKVKRLANPSSYNSSHQQLYDKRILFVSQHQVPYQSFSIISYKKMNSVFNNEKRHSALHTNTNTSGNFIEDIDMGDGRREVSYNHLLFPESWKHNCKEEEGEQGAVSQDYHVMEYDPLSVDDPQLTSGKHRKVLNLPSFTVSIIQYAKPSEVKKDINERFKEKFPHVTITLSKLRSLKDELLAISLKMSLDTAVVTFAFVYFEKVILKTRITKHNRKYIAGACLLLSIKFMDDIKSRNIKTCIEEICDQFRLCGKDLLSCELQVLVLLEFALLTPEHEALPMLKRLETSFSY